MNRVPPDFYEAVADVFVLERAALRAKKGPQGYLTVDDILEEPMMRKVLQKYGRRASRLFLVEMSSMPRKNPAKLLEFDPDTYLLYKARASPNNTSSLRIRPWAHKIHALQQQMESNYEESLRAQSASKLRATAAEFIPTAADAAADTAANESDRVANAMFGPQPTLRNIRNIWNRNTRRANNRNRSRRN
jgi:hypothetical protein